MADDRTKTDGRDRSRVASGQEYEVQYLAKDMGTTAEQVRDLVKRFGNDRETLEREARKLV